MSDIIIRSRLNFPFIRYGVNVTGLSVEDALVKADMAWQPKIANINAVGIERKDRPGLEYIPMDSHRLVFREMPDGYIVPIAPVRKKYRPSDPIKNFMAFDKWVKEKKMVLQSAGNYANRLLWLFGWLNGGDVEIGDDGIHWGVIAYDKLDGTAAIHVLFMPVREYCSNGLMVLDEKERLFEFRKTHTGTGVLDISAGIKKHMVRFDQYNRLFYEMQRQRYTADVAKTVYETYIRNVMFKDTPDNDSPRRQNIITTIKSIAEREAEKAQAHSLWGIYNAAVEYADHVYPKDNHGQRNIYNLLLGHGARIKRRAWVEAMAMLEN